MVPEQYREEYTQLGNLVLSVWAAFFRGQLILALIIGVIVGAGNAALGVPAALLLGILAGLLEALPNIGPILAAIPAVLLALLQGSSVLSVSNLVFALIVTLFYFVVQQLENNIIVPRLIGQAVDLPPVLVMAGVVVGASVGGILGAFMAAPLIATGRIVAQYAYNKVAGRSPFPAGRVPPTVQVETVSRGSVRVEPSALTAEDGPPAAEPPVSLDPGAREAAREVKGATPSVESLEG
jgi:predicted PurR-regulated permease PerM